MTHLKSRAAAFLIFAFWAVLIACGGAGGGSNSALNSITYTSENHSVYPNLNGEYSFDDGTGSWLTASTYEEFSFDFHLDASQNARVVLFVQTAPGTSLSAGQTYSWASSGTGWNFGTANDLNVPNPTNNIYLYSNVGTLTINSVTTNGDGSKRVSFSFNYGASPGVTGTGSGTCTVPQVFPF